VQSTFPTAAVQHCKNGLHIEENFGRSGTTSLCVSTLLILVVNLSNFPANPVIRPIDEIFEK